MNILVTGANGFLGFYLVRQLLQKNQIVIATGRGKCRLPFSSNNFIYTEMDFTDPYAVHDVFEKFSPGIVVHAGAMSKPDDCELQQWSAYITNVEGTITLLTNAADCKSHFIYISSDFVFDGVTGNYIETDLPQPINFYGKTKLDAEAAVQEYEYDWGISRTVLVYGKLYTGTGRGNILSVVKEKLEKGEEYHVVDDQFRTPTYVEDLASGIVSMVVKRAKGIYHLSGTDLLTPYQMACRTADHLGLDETLLKKVTAIDFSQPAKRPAKTGFIIDKAKRELGFEPVSFEEGLRKTFE